MVYNDIDGNGKRDKNDPGIAGRVIYGDANNNDKLDAGEVSTVTDASGRYKLTLSSDDVKVRQVVPAGWYDTEKSPVAALKATVPSFAVDPQVDEFATAKFSTMSGVVFRDANGNGKRDAGESGLAGAIVYLDANNNGWIDKNERTFTTGADGKWSLGNIPAGIRTVRIQPPKGKMLRTSASYHKHKLTSGSNWTKDDFGYA